jgi:hypothetical protein
MALTAAGVYPAHGRLALFLAPAWLAGLAAVIGAADRLAAGPLRIAVAVALVGAGAVRASELRIGAPRQRPRELVAAVGALLRPGDLVYVRPAAVPAWRHYAPRTGLPADVRVVLGVCARDRPAATALELERLRGERRVWALFSHTGVLPEHERAVERLLGAAGRARARIQADPSPRPAASDFAGLYDLSATERFDRALATHELARLRAAPPLSCRQYDGPAGGAG